MFYITTVFKLLVHEWTLGSWGLFVFAKGVRVDFSPTLFESSLALLEVGSVMFGTNDGDEDDEGSYDTDEDPLDLMIRG